MALFNLYGRGLAVITDHLRPLHRHAVSLPECRRRARHHHRRGDSHRHRSSPPSGKAEQPAIGAHLPRATIRSPIRPLDHAPSHALPPLAHLEFDLHGAVEGQDLERMVRLATEHVEM